MTEAASQALLLKKIEPEYPREAEAKGVEGDVVFRIIIGTDGRVEEVHLRRGKPVLIEAAAKAVSQWQYQPYILNGNAVEVETFATVRFRQRQTSVNCHERAVAVRVNLVPGIVPGARVDILVTDNPAGSADAHTAIVLQGVEVLALEQLKTESGGVVTVLTSPKDAEKLALASQKGRMILVPRN